MEDPPARRASDTPETAVGLAREARKRERLRRFDLDVRGMLAFSALIGAFGLAAANLATAGNAEIPPWAATTVGAIVGFYFGTRGTNGKGGDGDG